MSTCYSVSRRRRSELQPAGVLRRRSAESDCRGPRPCWKTTSTSDFPNRGQIQSWSHLQSHWNLSIRMIRSSTDQRPSLAELTTLEETCYLSASSASATASSLSSSLVSSLSVFSSPLLSSSLYLSCLLSLSLSVFWFTLHQSETSQQNCIPQWFTSKAQRQTCCWVSVSSEHKQKCKNYRLWFLEKVMCYRAGGFPRSSVYAKLG